MFGTRHEVAREHEMDIENQLISVTWYENMCASQITINNPPVVSPSPLVALEFLNIKHTMRRSPVVSCVRYATKTPSPDYLIDRLKFGALKNIR